MKKSQLKGFTLVELIVVMAIMAIFMVAVAMMWQPIRDVYVDSTLYETRRTAQYGVSQRSRRLQEHTFLKTAYTTTIIRILSQDIFQEKIPITMLNLPIPKKRS